MKRIASSLLATALLLGTGGAPVFAQGEPQTVSVVDVQSISTGYRASKIIGSDVRNAADELVGKIDDLIIGRGDNALYAIVSAGGFLGMGTKLVAVHYRDLKIRSDNKSFVLSRATKDELKALPEYKYAD